MYLIGLTIREVFHRRMVRHRLVYVVVGQVIVVAWTGHQKDTRYPFTYSHATQTGHRQLVREAELANDSIPL